VRRSLVNELRPFKSMEDCHRRARQNQLLSDSSLTPGELDDIIRGAGLTQNPLPHMIVTTTAAAAAIAAIATGPDSPRYCGSNGAGLHHHNSQHHYMSDGLSADGLHTQYAFDAGIASRSHSMPSLHSTPIHETPDEADGSEQYALRRSSDPAETAFVEQPRHSSFSHPVGDEYSSQRAAAAWPQAFTSEHSIAEVAPVSTADAVSVDAAAAAGWWGAATAEEEQKARVEASTQEWAQHGESSTHVLASQYGTTPHTPSASFDRGGSAEPYIKVHTAMVYACQPPSPGEEYVRTVRRFKSPAAPSPPESPGFQFDFGYNQQSWPTYPNFPQRRSSIPPTPPSRPPSTPNSSGHSNINTAVIAAAAAALAATKASKAKAQASRPASRRKSSSTSIRTAVKQLQLSTADASREMSFVNFTPKDANRLLNGVAPSGSSKTKARREREAMEKRRKLSEVAAAAVLAVGGDASVLAKVDLM